MRNIPIYPNPSQEMSINLGGQSCTLRIYTRSTGVYMDVLKNSVAVVSGALCLDRVKLIKYPALGFIGDIAFHDTQGTSDPEYTGFGTRYLLTYLEASDL
jgi:hypothetical protein